MCQQNIQTTEQNKKQYVKVQVTISYSIFQRMTHN